jgi:hypothetical protein
LITGTYPHQLLNLSLPVGDVGPAPNLEIGDVTLAGIGDGPSASITGDSPDYELNLVLPNPEITDYQDLLMVLDSGDGLISMNTTYIIDLGDGTLAVSAVPGDDVDGVLDGGGPGEGGDDSELDGGGP